MRGTRRGAGSSVPRDSSRFRTPSTSRAGVESIDETGRIDTKEDFPMSRPRRVSVRMLLACLCVLTARGARADGLPRKASLGAAVAPVPAQQRTRLRPKPW